MTTNRCPEYECECPVPERRPYVVTSHEGRRTRVSYCDDCAALAAIDWNGETAAIVAGNGEAAR